MSSDNLQGKHTSDQDTSSALDSTADTTSQAPSQQISLNNSPTPAEQPLTESPTITLEPITTEAAKTSAFSDTSSQPSPTSTNSTSQHTSSPPVPSPAQETTSTCVPGSPSQSTCQQPLLSSSPPTAGGGSIHTSSTSSQIPSPQGKGRRRSTSAPASASAPGYSQSSNSVFDEVVEEIPLDPRNRQNQQQHTRSLARNVVYNLNINSSAGGLWPLYNYEQHDFQPCQPLRVPPLYQEHWRIQYQDIPQTHNNRGQHQSQQEGGAQDHDAQQRQELPEDPEHQHSEEDEVFSEFSQEIHGQQQQQRANSTSQNTTHEVNANYPWPPPNYYSQQQQQQPPMQQPPPPPPPPQTQPQAQPPVNVGVVSNSITYFLLIVGS